MTMTTQKRDSQRSRVYKAEREAFPEHHARNSAMAGFKTTNECEIWVNRILRNKRAQKAAKNVALAFSAQDDDATKTYHDCYRWPTRISVEPNFGRGGAVAIGSNLIRVAGYFRNPFILLHETAHLIAPHEERHGPLFAAHLLALVGAVLGRKDADRLKDAYKRHRVRFRPKRYMSPERKAALSARLAQYRAATKAPTNEPALLPAHDTLTRYDPALLSAITIANLDGSYE